MNVTEEPVAVSTPVSAPPPEPLPGTAPCIWRTESDTPAPQKLSLAGDALKADEGLRRVRQGEFLLYRGDFHNARQLLAAMARRLPPARQASDLLSIFRAERLARAIEHDTLGRLVVELDEGYQLRGLRRAPGVSEACLQAWGPPQPGQGSTLVPFKTLLGLLGAAQWRKQGLAVPGLKKKLTPHYGVYLPTRTDYLELLSRVGAVKGLKCFDIGTGTGVLGLLLLERGAQSVVGTDVEPRAVACARENASLFKVGDRFTIEERELFPEGRADLVVCNPPWLPEPPKTRLDRAVFDEGGGMLSGFLSGLPTHLTPGGRGALVLSNLAELLGLRPPDFLDRELERCGLRVRERFEAKPSHGRAQDAADPLHKARSAEVTSLYLLTPVAG